MATNNVSNNKNRMSKGGMGLSSAKTTTTSTSYTKITGTWTDLVSSSNSFTVDGTGKITCNVDGCYLFNGESNLSATSAGRVTYALYKNGTLVPGAETPEDLVSASKIGAIGITSFIDLVATDYLEVFVKTDAANSVTSETLAITFLGD